MQKVKLGVIGCGDVAEHTYLPRIASLKETKIHFSAVCDIVEERAKKAKEKFGAHNYYTDYREMLEKEDIEAVVILTDMPSHPSITEEALEAGKHVYVEKVFAPTVEEADRLIEKAKASNVKLAVAPPYIINPLSIQTKRIIEEGIIGRICFIRAHGSHFGAAHGFRWTDATWYYKKGAGPAFDMGVYPLHLITGLLGPAKRVTCFSGIAIPERVHRAGPLKGKKIKVEVDDNTMILLDMGNSTFAYIDATFCVAAFNGPEMEFYGSKGVINLNTWVPGPPLEVYIDDQFGLKGWIRPPAKKCDISDGVEHLVDCIIENKEVINSAEHARHVIEIINKAMESNRTGKVMDLTTTFQVPSLTKLSSITHY